MYVCAPLRARITSIKLNRELFARFETFSPFSHYFQPTTFATMSSPSLFIGYARATCSIEAVKATLEAILGPDLIDRVDEAIKKDTKGYDFKMFFIHFKATCSQLEHTYTRIDKEDFVAFVYATEWDKRKWDDRKQEYGAYAQRYWKVTRYIKKDKPLTPAVVPHIMSAEEAALICPPKHTDPEAKRLKVMPKIENMFAALALEDGEVEDA